MIIAVKYAAIQFGKMGPMNISSFARGTLTKIHVITGWTIPEGETWAVLLDQFIKKIKEIYPDTNPEEWEYAFRNYGTGVKDWGKSMNLSLIDEVMKPYMSDRKYLSHEAEERKVEPPPTKIYTDEENDNLHRELTELFYQRLRSGKVEPIPMYCYPILVKDGLMKIGEDPNEFFVNALNSGRKGLYQKV